MTQLDWNTALAILGHQIQKLNLITVFQQQRNQLKVVLQNNKVKRTKIHFRALFVEIEQLCPKLPMLFIIS